mgnify:CR=1 FL=1
MAGFNGGESLGSAYVGDFPRLERRVEDVGVLLIGRASVLRAAHEASRRCRKVLPSKQVVLTGGWNESRASGGTIGEWEARGGNQ